MIVISDLSSLFVHSYLRVPQQALWKILFYDGRYGSIAKIIGFDTFAVVSSIYTLVLCRKCRAFSSATATTIKHFFQLVKDEPSDV